MNTAKKFLSREFLLIVVCFLFAFAVLKGWITSDRVNSATVEIGKVTDALPLLIIAIKDLVAGLAPLAGVMGLAYAYLRRRSDQKVTELENSKLNIPDSELERIRLELEKAKYEYAQEKLRMAAKMPPSP
jgi:hypothetical protein